MIKLKIDDREVEVPEGTSVLRAAEAAGIAIPALCLHNELEHFTSCMLCLVRDKGGKPFPSCSVKASAGMEIITEDEEIREGRQMALELLLSEHVGDCEAPCRIGCPANMNIPLMNRLIAAGEWKEALRVVKRDIALPAVLGRICPAPCEGACHRKTIDEAVSICLLKRFAGDENDLHPWPVPPLSGKRVAVIGAGPAGLAAAYYLRLRGVEPYLFDSNPRPGGLLRTAISREILPEEVLDREIRSILSTGITFSGGVTIDNSRLAQMRREYDAVVIATGNIDEITSSFQLAATPKGLEVSKGGYETSEPGVFAVGSVIRSSRLAVRSVGQGKEVAFAVLQFFAGDRVIGEPQLFNSRFGKLRETEFADYLLEAVADHRFSPSGIGGGFTPEEAVAEAARCMHCDCRAADNCKLRELSTLYDTSQKRFQSSPRRDMTKKFQSRGIVYEPQKCIKCGICVRLTQKYGEKLGLTFIGRGFDVEIGIPFSESLDAALEKIALKVAEGCPTGALEPIRGNQN